MVSKKCRCRDPKQHRDCMFCGSSWAGEVVCGVCRESGIDGKLIRGTGRVICEKHKKPKEPEQVRLIRAKVQQGNRNLLAKVVRDLEGDLEWSGYADCSTAWEIVFFTPKTPKQVQDEVWKQAESIWCEVWEEDQDKYFGEEAV